MARALAHLERIGDVSLKQRAVWATAGGVGMVIGLYILFSVVVGLMAIGRGGGFFLYFLLAMFLTPIVALIILIMATPITVDTKGAVVKKPWRKRPLPHG